MASLDRFMAQLRTWKFMSVLSASINFAFSLVEKKILNI